MLGIGVGLVPFFQIGASAEGSSVSGEDCAEEGRLAVVPGIKGGELVVAEVVDAIEVFGAIEGYEEDRGCRKGDLRVGDGGRRSREAWFRHFGEGSSSIVR